MNETYAFLIKRIKDRLKDPVSFVDLPDSTNKADFHRVPPPVSRPEMKEAEARLGFRLPALLRSLYLEVGNGGFGPGYGLIGLNKKGASNYHMDLVSEYLAAIEASSSAQPFWPEKFVTICSWGDGITSMLDCRAPEGAVYRFSGDHYEAGPYENALKFESPLLQAWLEDWLAGRPLFELV